MSTLSPNMSLVLPTIGIDSGVTWEQSVNTNSVILDGHNHSVGSGIQINPSGININADFPFNGFNATTLRSIRFNAQTSPIALPTDIGSVYVSGVDLYYNDINGNQIQITSGGTVNATSSGISSGTATASFSSNTLVVNSASNTPANIQGASILIGNTGTSGSKFITLSPTGTLSSNYNLNLPIIPAQTNIMTLDPSGNIAAVLNVDNSTIEISSNLIQLAPVGQQISAGCGSFNTVTQIAVTNLSVTLTTIGRPVMVFIQPVGGSSSADINISGNGTGNLFYFRGATLICQMQFITNGPAATQIPLLFLDTPTAGTYTYTVQASAGAPATINIINFSLVAYEL